MIPEEIIIATRKSRLALWQAEHIKNQLKIYHPEVKVKLLTRLTTADKNLNVPLSEIGGKELFVKELQSAILNGEAHIAVHSMKDLSCTPHPELKIAAICKREDPRDAFISRRYKQFSELPQGAIIGTSSPRRECQLKALRPDLQFKLLRGNVDTRLNKLDGNEFDAIILAAAGLIRLGFSNQITEYFPTTMLLPAIGQGAIGIECRQDDTFITRLLTSLNHEESQLCVMSERAVNAYLGGDCFTPIAAYALLENNQIHLKALVGSRITGETLTAEAYAPKELNESVGVTIAKTLLQQGAERLINRGQHV